MHTPEQVAGVLRRQGPHAGRVLDASCGEGRLANLLAREGYDVVASTLSTRPALDPEVAWHPGVDLNLRLPFEDDAFDLVILQEVIEHLENPAHVVREVNRVLRPGGRLVLTTPNAACLRSRLHFLLTGYVKGRRRPASYDRPPGDYANVFIPALPTLHYLWWSYGFRLAGLGRSRRRAGSVALAPLWPLVAAWTRWYACPQKGSTEHHSAACHELQRVQLSAHALLDENLVLLLEKSHGLEGLYVPAAGETYRPSRLGD